MQKILLLEDDEILAESLEELLESESFSVYRVENGEEAIDIAYENHFDIYIFDVNVAKLNGFELLLQLRQSGDTTPTIFLTAMGDIASIAKGFDVGADDYIKKPFDFDELLIRIKAILKKQFHSFSNKIAVENFVFDIEKNELYRDGSFLALAPVELHLSRIFFKNLHHTLPKEVLLDELSNDKEMSEGSLRVHINKLRKLALPISTIKGVGYRLGNT